MLKAYEYRIYPTPEQEVFLAKASGLCRLYWNLSLSAVQTAYENQEKWKVEYAKTVFEKYRPEAVKWMKEIDSAILADQWNNISSSFNNFFKSCKGQRKTRIGFLNYKSKKDSSICVTWNSLATPKITKNGYLVITRKLGPVKGVFHRWAYGTFKHATIKQTKTGKWFVKICVDKKEEPKNQSGKSVGIDWNCRDDSFITLSNGMKVKCPRYLEKKQRQLEHQQRLLSKKYKKGLEVQSNNYYKQQLKVALLHEKVANQRKDWLHKLSRNLCNQYQTIVVEDINLQTMASKLHHGKVIGDQGFGMLREMIKYKGHLVKVSSKNTSKICHSCGYINENLKLGTEIWECPNCGEIHDRDINAALNILYKYNTSQSIVGGKLAEITNACGEPRSSEKQEISKSSSFEVNLES